MSQLITVPTFYFEQGEIFEEDGAEFPLLVSYYSNGVIQLSQRGNEVIIGKKHFESLVKQIRKHLPEAEKALKE